MKLSRPFNKKSLLAVMVILTSAILACQLPFMPETGLPDLLSQDNTSAISGPTLGPFKSLMQLTNAPIGQLSDTWLADNGDLWTTSNNGIFLFQKNSWQKIWDQKADDILKADKNGHIWVVLNGGAAVGAIDHLKVTQYGEKEGWTALGQWTHSITGFGMVTDTKGRMWITTSLDDVRRFDPQRNHWESLSSQQMGFKSAQDINMDDNLVVGSSLTNEGNVWISVCSSSGDALNGQGVNSFDGQNWKAIPQTADQCVVNMQKDPSGNIWLGGYDKMMFYNAANKSWKDYPLPTFERTQLAYGIHLDSKQRPWIQVARYGGASMLGEDVVYYWNDSKWVDVFHPDHWVDTDLKTTQDGDVWMCAQGDVYHFKDGIMQLLAQFNSLGCSVSTANGSQVYITALDGKNAGIWKLDPKQPLVEITPAPIPTELPATEVPIPAPAEPTAPPQPPAAQPSGSNHAPLGVSRVYMMDQYGVFIFQKPYTTDYGVEAIMGYHQTMCIDKDCAAITLMGPADNLLLIGMAVPTNPNDDVEITSAIALLGHLTFDITKDDSFSGQLIKDFVDAVTSQKTLDKKYNVNGFIISESVKPNNGHFVAAMTITK